MTAIKKIGWVPASVVGMIAAGIQVGAAPPRVQFSKQVLPLLNRECLSCHRGPAAPGGYSTESAERLVSGGRHGAAVVAGKGSTGTLVRYLTGELKPQMPPGKPLDLETIALIRRWIDEGAKIDSMVDPTRPGGVMRDAMPMKPGLPAPLKSPPASSGARVLLPTAVSQAAPVTALQFSPNGRWIAAGGYRAVRLLNPQSGELVRTLSGPADQVLSLAWSTDGKRLVAAGGIPGSHGEVCLWDGNGPEPSGQPRVLREHAETIAGVALRPGTQEMTTVSPDRSVKIWDLTSGKVVRTLKHHVDAVYGVAYSADGKWLATASADRTVKLYQIGSPVPPTSLPHGEGVSGVAFSPKGDLLVSCADRQVRVWPVKAGSIQNPLRQHGEGETINSISFSSEGGLMVWGASNRRVRLWNAEVTAQRREMGDVQDWVYSVAASPDGKLVAGGTADGRVYFWDVSGKLLRTISLGPASVPAATPGGGQ